MGVFNVRRCKYMKLLLLLTKIIQYKLTGGQLTEIKQILSDGGGVWQKFGQMLSSQPDIIGKELANELSCFQSNCPSHSDEYTIQVIQEELGSDYNTDKMKLVGSGTISQVYKMPLRSDPSRKVAIKVMHPNIETEIQDALCSYNSVKDSILFPSVLKIVCKLFFNGLSNQIDTRREYKFGRKMNELFNKPNGLIIVPTMIEYSKRCIVMSYEKSQSIDNMEVDKHVEMKLCNGLTLFYTFAHLNRRFVYRHLGYAEMLNIIKVGLSVAK